MTTALTHPKDSRYERYRWQIFAVTWLAYAGFYLTRKSFSVAKVAMVPAKAKGVCYAATNLTMTTSQMAWIDAGYLVAYAIGQFVWGMLGDKVGTRRVILTGMLCSVLAGLAMGVSTITTLFGIFFIIQGLCQSSGWAPLSKNIGTFFSQRERGTIMGMWCTNYAVGGFIASAFAGGAALYFCDWRYAFYLPAGALFVVWLLFYFLQANKPEDVGLPPIETYHQEAEAVLEADDAPEEEEEGTWHTIGQVLRNRMVLLLGSVYFFLKPTRYAILFWGPLYISEKMGANILKSGVLSSLFELAGPLSIFLGGYLSDKLFRSKRMPISIICLFGLFGMLLVLDKLPATSFYLGGCFFMIGFLLYAPDSLVSGTAALDFGTKKGASTAAGFINGCGSIGAIIGGTVPGFFKAQWGWSGVFLFMAGSVLFAALLLLPQWNALPSTGKAAPPQQATT